MIHSSHLSDSNKLNWTVNISNFVNKVCHYPLVNCYTTMENHYVSWSFMGKSTISMAIFDRYVTVYQAGYECWVLNSIWQYLPHGSPIQWNHYFFYHEINVQFHYGFCWWYIYSLHGVYKSIYNVLGAPPCINVHKHISEWSSLIFICLVVDHVDLPLWKIMDLKSVGIRLFHSQLFMESQSKFQDIPRFQSPPTSYITDIIRHQTPWNQWNPTLFFGEIQS